MKPEKKDTPHEVIIEDNYNGKYREGRVTFPANVQPVVDHVERGFTSHDFKVRYVSHLTMEVERDFTYDNPFKKIGMIELDFFEYANHSVVYYKTFSLLGLSYVSLSLILIYGFVSLTWLSKHGGTADTWKIVLPLLGFVGTFIYQRLSTYLRMKAIIKDVMMTFKVH